MLVSDIMIESIAFGSVIGAGIASLIILILLAIVLHKLFTKERA